MFSSIARLGAMVTPYVAQVMMPEVSEIGALSLYASVTLVVSIVSLFLPIETKGRQLPVCLYIIFHCLVLHLRKLEFYI
ncbi:putative sugar transporter [Schistosoma mansoni]|uniref:putative sugar transporter n=1 Tax=Schistosoma mansoni TaxID=6183 RepID=UPI00022DCBCC|nr:putative sugar transporter [Schistosoma mansoni]|eukprot:XP_018654266.1 putative sugar transporter [Schistosoma mansoni]